MDKWFSKHKDLRYVRFMDDFLILAKSRWHLRDAVAQLNGFFDVFGFKQHPDKTFIGWVDKGFDWMGYQFDSSGVIAASPRTIEKHGIKLRQLYEQARRLSLSDKETERRVAEYCVRWQKWLLSGLSTVILQPLTGWIKKVPKLTTIFHCPTLPSDL